MPRSAAPYLVAVGKLRKLSAPEVLNAVKETQFAHGTSLYGGLLASDIPAQIAPRHGFDSIRALEGKHPVTVYL
ncbi:MAG TPA: hypothetical protein VGN26_14170 [Armatimonadota bacterium]|jgi:hypothetical protein